MVDVGLTIISRNCIECGKTVQFQCHPADLLAWQRGELIQDALWYVSPDHREILISQICGECFDRLFGENENE